MRVLTSATTVMGLEAAAKLRAAGCAVTMADTAQMMFDALDLLGRPAVLLESDLPDMAWTTALTRLRASHSDMTLLVLNTQQSRDIVQDALQSGADDVIDPDTPPAELGARVRSIVARRAGFAGPVLTMGDLRLDLCTQSVAWRGVDVPLSPSHFVILQSVCLAAPLVVTKQVVLAELYGLDTGCDLRSIDVFIAQLRSRLEEVGASRDLIETRRGQGYRLAMAKAFGDPAWRDITAGLTAPIRRIA